MVALPLALNFGGSGSPQPMDTDNVSMRITNGPLFPTFPPFNLSPQFSLCTVASAPVIVQMYISPNWTRHVIVVVLLLSVTAHVAETICLLCFIFTLFTPVNFFFPLHCIYLFLCTSPFFIDSLFLALGLAESYERRQSPHGPPSFFVFSALYIYRYYLNSTRSLG
jgi:hypothetical protein